MHMKRLLLALPGMMAFSLMLGCADASPINDAALSKTVASQLNGVRIGGYAGSHCVVVDWKKAGDGQLTADFHSSSRPDCSPSSTEGLSNRKNVLVLVSGSPENARLDIIHKGGVYTLHYVAHSLHMLGNAGDTGDNQPWAMDMSRVDKLP
jgi:hypothetical protein